MALIVARAWGSYRLMAGYSWETIVIKINV